MLSFAKHLLRENHEITVCYCTQGIDLLRRKPHHRKGLHQPRISNTLMTLNRELDSERILVC
jgi:hypothetical protein